EHASQCSVQKVGSGVIALGIAASIAWDRRVRFADVNFSGCFPDSGDAAIDLPHFIDVDAPAFADDLAPIRDLTARFGIERRLAQNYRGASVGQLALGEYGGVDVERVVAGEGDTIAAARPSTFSE